MAAELTNRAVAEAMGWDVRWGGYACTPQISLTLYSGGGCYKRGEEIRSCLPDYLDDPALLGEMLEWLKARGMELHAVRISEPLGVAFATGERLSLSCPRSRPFHTWILVHGKVLKTEGDTLQRAVAALVVAVKEANDG